MSAINSVPAFNPQSPEYSAVFYAGTGDVAELAKVIQENPTVLDKPVIMDPEKVSLFTAGHYAVKGDHWEVIAYLINRGFNWNLRSSTPKNPEGLSALKALGTKEGCLVKIFTELSREKSQVNAEAVVELLLSSEIPVERRREVIADRKLCIDFSKKVKPDEALLIMMLLMKDSFAWEGMKTDFPKLCFQDTLHWDARLNPHDTFLYALYLTGIREFMQIYEETLKNVPRFSQNEVTSSNRPNISPEQLEIMKSTGNKVISENLGLKERTEQFELNLSAQNRNPVQLFCLVNQNGFVDQYGVLFCHKGRNWVVSLERAPELNYTFPNFQMFRNFEAQAKRTPFREKGINYQIASVDPQAKTIKLISPGVHVESAEEYFRDVPLRLPIAKVYSFPTPWTAG